MANQYSSEILEETVVADIGGKWQYRKLKIKDNHGSIKIRLVKGKVKPDGTFSQVQRINFTQKDWERGHVDAIIKALISSMEQLWGAK